MLDYIKKAREAQQPDDQSRALLYKNGWTEAEVVEAMSALTPTQSTVLQTKPQFQPINQSQPQTAQPQPASQPGPQTQPQVQVQPQVQAEPSFQSVILQNTPVQQPQAQPIQTVKTAPVQSMYTLSEKPRSHFIAKLSIVLVILIALVGIYFTAGQYVNLPYSGYLWSIFSPNSQTIVDNMVTATKNVKAMHSITSIEIGKFAINANSETDFTDASNPKADGNFTFNFSQAAGQAATGSINMAFVNGVFYFKVNELADPSNTISFGDDKAKVIGKWLKIDQNSIKTLATAQGTQIPTPNLNLDFTNLFSNLKQLGSQIISGQDTYHYSATVTKAKTSAMLAKSGLSAYADQIANLVGDTNAEIWIGKTDYLLYQIKIDSPKIKANIANSNFNKQITVAEPAGAGKFEDLALPFLKAEKIRIDIQAIGNSAKAIFAETQKYLLLCATNGYIKAPKGASQSPSLISAVSDLIKNGSSNPACLSAAQDFCVSTKLPNGTYLCVDKNNLLGTTQCLTYKTACK